MFTRRLTRRLLLTALVLGPGAVISFAQTASAPLVVSVTVVRSCAITATPGGQGQATVNVRCTSGAASGLRIPRSGNVPTVPFRGSRITDDVQVVTLDF